MKRIYPVFFVAIVFSFSAMMLIFSLLGSIKLSAVKDSVNRVIKESAELQAENERLSARYESSIAIEEIERYAIDVLGMQHCTAAQIEYIQISESLG